MFADGCIASWCRGSAADNGDKLRVKVVASNVASAPIALSSLARLPLGQLTTYAREMFQPTSAPETPGADLPMAARSGLPTFALPSLGAAGK